MTEPAAAPERVLAFMNEVAGGRKLLTAVRERAEQGAQVAVVAPRNQPAVGHRVPSGELRDAAQSRVDVTVEVLGDFGIEAEGQVMDADPMLALDDGVRAYRPDEIFISCMADTRCGPLRRDLVEWARGRFRADVVHVPVRIEDDAVRWDVTHTLVVATQTVNSPDLIAHLKSEAAQRPHRYTFVCPRSGEIARAEVCRRLARTLAELYRSEVDATGQPMSPEPFAAVQNAIAHYRIDEILISTLAGQQSKWLEEGLVERVGAITDKPVSHVECASTGATAEPVGAGAGFGG